MITVKYTDGRTEQRTFALISGENPIGNARPIPDDATVRVLDGCITVTMGEGKDTSTVIRPWSKITELTLGPIVSETVLLRTSEVNRYSL